MGDFIPGMGPSHRPDVSEQAGEARHEEDRERARQESMANAARPSWWQRLKSKFNRR